MYLHKQISNPRTSQLLIFLTNYFLFKLTTFCVLMFSYASVEHGEIYLQTQVKNNWGISINQGVPGRYRTLGIAVFSSHPLAGRTCQTPVTLAPLLRLPILDLLILRDPLYRVVRVRLSLRMTSPPAITLESQSKDARARSSPASSFFVVRASWQISARGTFYLLVYRLWL